MKLGQRQAGFSAIEITIAIVIIAIVGFLAYAFYTSYRTQANETVSTKTNDVQSAPDIKSSTDLDKAQTTVDTTEIESGNTDDLNNIDKDLSEF